jgi:hypothetical protein
MKENSVASCRKPSAAWFGKPLRYSSRRSGCLEMIVRGEAVDSDALIRVSSTSKRLLSIIAAKTGKRKPAKGPTIGDYLARKAAEKAGGASQGGAT